MQIAIEIKRISYDSFDELKNILHSSFGTVASKFHLTKDNNPTNGAFITTDQLKSRIESGLIMYGYYKNKVLIGSVGIKQSKVVDEYYIEKLCVLAEYRHNGVGYDLLNYAEKEIINRNGKFASIGIINKNQILKQWYNKNGYNEAEIKIYEYLPFEICILKRKLTI